MSSDKLITEQLIKNVQRDLYPLTLQDALRRLEILEPDLRHAIIRWAGEAVQHLDEAEVDDVARCNVHEAVQWSVVVALEVMHRAYWELWKDTVLEPRLARLNDDLGRAADDRQA